MKPTSPQRRTRNSYRWQKLRAAAKARDGYRCRQCATTHALEVHHIDENTNNWAMSNLITLCDRCHHTAHGQILGR